jgi:hypothetical protein
LTVDRSPPVVTGGPDAAGEVRFADLHRFVFQRGRHRGVPEVDEAGRRDGGYDLDDVLFVPMPVQLGEPCVGDGVGGAPAAAAAFSAGLLDRALQDHEGANTRLSAMDPASA